MVLDFYQEHLLQNIFADQVRIRLISQLINGISTVLQKLLKCFNGTITLRSFSPLFFIPPAISVLNLNEALLLLSAGKLAIAPLASKIGSSL